MKKMLLLLITFLPLFAFGQSSFTFQTDSLTKSRPLGSEIVFSVPVTNTSAQTITVSIVRRANILPGPLWQSSMCFDENCFAPDLDSVATTPDYFSTPVQPGQTRDFSLHVYSMGVEGTGKITLTAKNNRNAADSVSIELFAKASTVGIDKNTSPASFAMLTNYPNPFNPSTKIRYSLDGKTDLHLSVFNVLGERIATLVNRVEEAGVHEITFDASAYNLPSGMYMIVMQTEGFTKLQKAILAK